MPDEVQDVRRKVRAFVEEELHPLEPQSIMWELEATARTEPFEAEDGVSYAFDPLGDLPSEVYQGLLESAEKRGLWGFDVPEEFGGQNVGVLAKMVAVEEMSKTVVPFILPPESPNLHWLMQVATEDQRERYLEPYARGRATSGVAITEPSAGSDVSGMSTMATRDGDGWLINGTKKWIGKADWGDFLIVVAVTDPEKRARGGMTAFLIDRGTPGVDVIRRLPTISNYRPCEVQFNDVRVGDEQVLGEIGQAFVPLQNRFGIRRLEIASRSVGAVERLLDMMIDYTTKRVTFGQPLADRQMIQQWIADGVMGLHACRLINYDAARKLDRGVVDIRQEAATAKVMATELLSRVADWCLQAHGGVGLGKDLPIESYTRLVRIWRIVEGASEVHRVSIARRAIGDGRVSIEV